MKDQPAHPCANCLLSAGDDQRPGRCQEVHHFKARRGQILYSEGFPGTPVFFIRSGTVKLERVDGHADRHIVELLGPGDIFGLGSLSEQPSTSTAMALDDCHLCTKTAIDIRSQMSADAQLSLRLVGYLHGQLERARNRQTWLSSSSAQTRLAAYLANRMEAHSPQGEIPRDLNLSDLGALLGLAPETVCRALAALRKKGVVRTDPKTIHVLDRPALYHIARTLEADQPLR